MTVAVDMGRKATKTNKQTFGLGRMCPKRIWTKAGRDFDFFRIYGTTFIKPNKLNSSGYTNILHPQANSFTPLFNWMFSLALTIC